MKQAYFIFNTYKGDSTYNNKSGQKCKILKAIPLKDYDWFDVGFMYKVILEDGTIISAFSDELTLMQIESI